MTVYDNFPKAPYPEGKYSYSAEESVGDPYTFDPIEDYDTPMVLHIRNFTQGVELKDVTVKDLEYHTMDYLDGIPISRFTKRSALPINTESWFGGGLTQEDLDFDLIEETGYTQAMLDLLTQHGIEQAPAIINDPYLYGMPSLHLVLAAGDESHYSSIYEDDNLMSPPFDDPLGDYEIHVRAALLGGKSTPDNDSFEDHLDEFTITFSSSLVNDPSETDEFDMLATTIQTGGIGFNTNELPGPVRIQGALKFSRDLIVNADPTRIKRIDIRVKTKSTNDDPTELVIASIRLIDATAERVSAAIDTKRGVLAPLVWTYGGQPDPLPPDPIYNIGQNKAKDYTHYTRFTRSGLNTTDDYSALSGVAIHHRVDDSGFPKLTVSIVCTRYQVGIHHWINFYEDGVLRGLHRRDWVNMPPSHHGEFLIQTDLEGGKARTLLWEVGPGGSKGTLLYNSQEYESPINIDNSPGRVALQLPSPNPSNSSFIEYGFARDVVVGEAKTNPFKTITPIIGATIYANSSPARQLIRDYFSGQEGNAINHLGSPVKESGDNNGGFEIVPGSNDVTVSLDTDRIYAGLPSYRIRKHSNALIGGMQWAEPIRMSDPGRSSVTGAIRFDNNVLDGSFRVVFWDEHFRSIQLILPIKIENTPGRWHQFNIPVGTDNIMELNYKVQIQHIGPTQGVGSFWVGGFRVQTDTVEWSLSNDGERFVSAAGALNTPFSSVNFTRPGKTLTTRARAYHPTAWINRLEVTPRWDRTGVLIPPNEISLTYASLPEMPEIDSYEDIPEVFESYSEMEDQ